MILGHWVFYLVRFKTVYPRPVVNRYNRYGLGQPEERTKSHRAPRNSYRTKKALEIHQHDGAATVVRPRQAHSTSSESGYETDSGSDIDFDYESRFGDADGDISQAPFNIGDEAVEYALKTQIVLQKATLIDKLTARNDASSLEPQSPPQSPQPVESNTTYSVLTACYTKSNEMMAEIEYLTTDSLSRDQAVFQWV